jgi:FtsH-binding integral membrane protein
MESSTDEDREHLRLLTIFYYIWAGIQSLGGLIGLAFIGVGAFIASSPQIAQNNNPPPPWFSAIFAGLGALVFVSVEGMAALSFFTGRFLSRRQHHTFCVVVSVLNCLSLPFGTALGVFTLIVLQRPSVKALFAGNEQSMGVPVS